MRRIIWDTDSQKDFINPNGKLYVTGAEIIKGNIKRVLISALDNYVPIFGSVDAHSPEDEELKNYPAHCVVGTEGQEKIPESIVCHSDNVYYIANTGNGFDMNVFEGAQQIYFEKQDTNVWDKTLGQPDNIQTMLRMLDVTDVYVIGVATNICDIAAIRGFAERKYNVHVITDAIKGLDIPENPVYPATEELALDEMMTLGCRFITTDEFVAEVENNG